MKKSLKARRMERKNRPQEATLSLTALMDVFTVLVFMLLINSSDGIQINDTRELKMPASTASELPKENLLVMIVKSDIIVSGIKVGEITPINDKQELDLKGLNDELTHQAERRPELTEEEKEFGRPVTIQADRKLPYSVLKQIMATCAQAEFRNISLAVTHVAGER